MLISVCVLINGASNILDPLQAYTVRYVYLFLNTLLGVPVNDVECQSVAKTIVTGVVIRSFTNLSALLRYLRPWFSEIVIVA